MIKKRDLNPAFFMDMCNFWIADRSYRYMTEEKFISLILPLRDRLFRIAWHIMRNREEAEDIVQDVMLRIWNKAEEVLQIECMEAYCYTMAKNLALNRIELKVNQQVDLENKQDIWREEGPLLQLEENERVSLLLQLMEQLPEPQRDIIQLRDVEGMSYSEIALTLRLTEEQVKVYLFRARKKIKELYLTLDSYGLQTN